ncbi:hypothetical protein GOARA_013_00050 [Gordonia araii NBRC 100433]|uniref:Uncharacterized protein n=1 Tax=Gordonia araii NBRC 100433 TaxID=1073574 RepID=G7GY86_9ACTN|nr:hypothetical protein GOARA_013_00050 [Gordonia araii NBRC 100433]
MRQVASVWAFVGKMIPMLVLTILFFLCAPEAWQLTAHMSRARLWSAALLLGLAGVAFILVAAIDNLRHSRQEALERGDYRPLTRAERLNAVALVVIVQFTQALLLAVMTFLFFTLLATVLVPQDVMLDWICPGVVNANPGQVPDLVSHCSMVTLHPDDAVSGAVAANPNGPWLEQGTLFRIGTPFLPQVLIQVCILIASVAAVAFVGSSVLESQHHKDFYQPVLNHVQEVMQRRDRYLYRDDAQP